MKKAANLFILTLLFSGLFAQSGSSLLPFSGKIFSNYSTAKNVVIKLYDGNKKISEYETKRNGKFIMDLERNKNYTVEFSKTDHVTKRIMINTHLNPVEAAAVNEFKFDVSLIEEEEGINYSSLDFPIALIEYEKVIGEFNYNKDYTENMLEEQNRLIDESSQMTAME